MVFPLGRSHDARYNAVVTSADPCMRNADALVCPCLGHTPKVEAVVKRCATLRAILPSGKVSLHSGAR